MIRLRDEQCSDIATIRATIECAFATAPHSSGTEAAIVDGLRVAGALTLSLVAVADDEIVGHVAFSPVNIDGESCGWFGLGPVAVRPDKQGCGIGELLIRRGLERLMKMEAHGCVVVGEPDYYRRFGFLRDPELRYGNVPAGYLQRIVFKGAAPKGIVEYHPAIAE